MKEKNWRQADCAGTEGGEVNRKSATNQAARFLESAASPGKLSRIVGSGAIAVAGGAFILLLDHDTQGMILTLNLGSQMTDLE